MIIVYFEIFNFYRCWKSIVTNPTLRSCKNACACKAK